jgi:hypothetical protein
VKPSLQGMNLGENFESAGAIHLKLNAVLLIEQFEFINIAPATATGNISQSSDEILKIIIVEREPKLYS